MWKLNVLDVFEYELEEIQTLDVVEEELELSLDEGKAIFKEEHDSSTLEPIYDNGFTLLKELLILPIWILPMIKIMHFLIIWVSYFILLHPTIPYFAAFILMKYG